MTWLRRLLVLLVGVAGSIAASQAPEFAQQYRQRLGGALDELRQIVADFDADAARNGLTRDTALAEYERSGSPFLTDRGERMADILRRFEALTAQKAAIDAAPPVMRPVVVLRSPDTRLLAGTRLDFEPAVPVTAAGLIWAAIGFILFELAGWTIVKLIALPFSRRRRRAGREAPPEALEATASAPLPTSDFTSGIGRRSTWQGS